MLLTRALMLSVLGVLSSWRLGVSQCPDGTPPPCRAAAPAPTRRAAPPLDERTWIVLPFENVARVQDIDWLRDASVNLLYLDMSRWRDIRVIDDERVADFMREVPQSRGPMGLNTGIAVARRAGAGKLVMGDLLKVGSRTQVVAKVFDVRTGQRVRSVREETSNPDSIMAVFGRLARGILNVAPPPGVRGGTIGTASLAAYQEYLAGVQALNAFDLTIARERFTRALALDSTFALAHYKLSVAIGWENPNLAERLRHAQAASRFAGQLPARERALIAGQVSQSGNRWTEACETYHGLVRADSTDVEAWYNVGECEYHDPSLEAENGDTTRLRFRGDWNAALRAFRRTLELDPSFHLAYSHIPDILHTDQRPGCVPPPGQTTCAAGANYLHTAVVLRQGDTLALTPVSAMGGVALRAQIEEAARNGTRRANYLQARDLAAEWVQAAPGESRARMALGRALLRLGDAAGADRELRQIGGARSPLERLFLAQDRIEIALKTGRYGEAGAVMDTIMAAVDSLGVGGFSVQVAILGATLGRFATADARLAPVVPATSGPYLALAMRLMAGVPPDSAERVARDFGEVATRAGARPADVYAQLSPWAVRWLRTWPSVPPLDTAVRDPRLRAAAFALRGDTAGLRSAALTLDSVIGQTPPEMPENGLHLAAAEAWLVLGDSARALERLVGYEARWPLIQPLERMTSGFAFNAFLWPRTFMLLGDLAAAAGRTDVAVRAYRRAAGMWMTGDAEVQPEVRRARAALARLGPPGG